MALTAPVLDHEAHVPDLRNRRGADWQTMSEAKLRVHDAHEKRLIVLDKPLFTIGRRTTADLYLRPGDVSRDHAQIARDGDQYLLRDTSSRGTFVNGQQITTHTLVDGDRIRFGQNDVEIVFEADTTSMTVLIETASDVANLGQMAAILNGLRALGSGRVLAEVLAMVLDGALEVTRAERGFIMLANEKGELEFKTARGVGRVTLPGTSFATSRQIPREVFATDRAQLVTDLTEGRAGHDHTVAVGIRHVMCVPLRVASRVAADASSEGDHRVLGVLYLDGHEPSTMRSSAVLSALEAFATQAALAIESARLYAEAAEKARVDQDLCLAAEIQRSLLGAPAFSGERFDLAAVAIPCRTIGGDFYDYLELGDGSLAFALGDVAGKGPPAALLAAVVQSNFVAQASVGSDPGQTTARVNTAMLRRPIEARFATMFHGVLTSDGRLSYCNAGQEPAIVVGRDEVVWLEVGGPVLGLFTVDGYACETVQLKPDDLVIVYSDGVTEATNVGGDEFGRERLVESIAGGHGTKPEALLERVLDAVRTFSRDAPQADDITVLILRYRRSATEVRT